MQVSINLDGLDKLKKDLRNFSGQRFNAAISTALTKSAKEISNTWKKQIEEKVDRPNARTKGAAMFIGARADKLVAEVKIKDIMQGTAPDLYLKAQEKGGDRIVKKFERALINSGAMPRGYLTVPGRGAARDSYGNVSRSVMVAVVAQLGADFSPGYARVIGKTTERRLAIAAKKGKRYIVVLPSQEKRAQASAGIYERTDDGSRKAIFLYKRQVSYRRLLSLMDRANQDAQEVMQRQLADAIKASAARLAARG